MLLEDSPNYLTRVHELRARRRKQLLMAGVEAYQAAIQAGARAAVVLGRASGAASETAAVEAGRASWQHHGGFRQPELTY